MQSNFMRTRAEVGRPDRMQLLHLGKAVRYMNLEAKGQIWVEDTNVGVDGIQMVLKSKAGPHHQGSECG